MTNIDTLICARWVLPIEPSHTLLTDYAVAIHDGKIVAILPVAEAKMQYQATETHDLSSHAVMPGLVNAHAHSPMLLFRGLADDLPLMTWLNDHIWPAENQWISEQFIEDSTEFAIAEMVRSGTTCFNEHYFFPGTTAKVATQMGMRARVGLQVMDVPTPWAKTAQEAIDRGMEVVPEYQDHPLISMSFGPHAPYTLQDDSLIKIKTLADQHQLPVHIHMHESETEITESLKQYGKRPLKRFDDLGVLDARWQHVHMTQVNEEDIEILQKTGGHVVHCPESNLKLASGFCPVDQLVNANINVALGTDGAASNNDLDMFAEMRTAALLAKPVAKNPTAVPAMLALEMATINGAKALQLDDVIGSLVPGKSADLIAINLDALNTQPVYHPASQLVYALNSQQVSDVWIAGQQLLKAGRFTRYDEADLLHRLKQWGDKITSAHDKTL